MNAGELPEAAASCIIVNFLHNSIKRRPQTKSIFFSARGYVQCKAIHAILPGCCSYRKQLINSANGSCMFCVLVKFTLVEVKDKDD